MEGAEHAWGRDWSPLLRGLGNGIWNEARHVVVDSQGASYSAGDFAGTIDFNPGPDTSNITAVGILFNNFLLKLDNPMNTVWIDFAYNGTEAGTNSQPYNSLAEALSQVSDGGTIRIKGDTADASTPETMTINHNVTLEAVNGTVTIGQ